MIKRRTGPHDQPPRLLSLIRDDYRPAYQFYLPPPARRADDLRGKKQRVRGLPASLEGDRTLIETTAGAIERKNARFFTGRQEA